MIKLLPVFDTIIFMIKDPNFTFLLSLYQLKAIKTYPNFSSKDLKDQCIGKNIKQKVRTKKQQTSIYIFPEANFTDINKLLVLVY